MAAGEGFERRLRRHYGPAGRNRIISCEGSNPTERYNKNAHTRWCGRFCGSGRRIRTAQGLFQAVSANVIKYRQVLQILAFSKSIFHHVSKGNSQSYRDKGQDKGQKQGGIRESSALFPLLQNGFEGIPTHNKYAVKSSKAQIINCQEMYLKSRYIFR